MRRCAVGCRPVDWLRCIEPPDGDLVEVAEFLLNRHFVMRQPGSHSQDLGSQYSGRCRQSESQAEYGEQHSGRLRQPDASQFPDQRRDQQAENQRNGERNKYTAPEIQQR
jgi:hypothetical protein